MLRKLLFTAMVCLVSAGAAFAQSGTLTGTVTDQSSGETLPGVNIFIQELQRGTATDAEGNFTIEDIEYGTYTVRATYVGYDDFQQEVTIDQQETTLDFSLTSQTQQLDDVVVTAFGMSRDEKSTSYSVQEVSGDDVARVDQSNIVGALAGKVSGVQVIGAAGANIGGSEKIRIRGASGLSDGQPLFVVDGTPISNQSFSASTRGRDFGNLAQDLNLQDIESVSVLKGASASALYGNRASNGVILITTKSGQMGGDGSVQIDFSNSTSVEEVYILPDYQNQYAGGYTQDFLQYTDPEDGQTYNGLNYAADESWGPPIEGQMYRPWYSWFHGDFTGDGQDDYGTTVPLTANPDNVRNFYETGYSVSNSLAISGGSSNASYRASIKDSKTNGVIPNSELDKTYLNFNGSLRHGGGLSSSISFNYVNTHTKGRPALGYSPVQGNPTQSFNQWFQRQLDMSKVRNYRLDDGTLTSWNIRSNTNLRPLYWNSPYFSVYENVPIDDRDRVYGNYGLTYKVNENIELEGKVKADIYDFVTEDRIASGGLETDWYSVTQRNRREMNYEVTARYEEDFQNFSVSGLVGGNLRQERYRSVDQSTVGGLSTPNLYTIEASVNRPDVSSYLSQKDVRSVYGTATVGYKDMVYVDGSVRNDWSSALPSDNNSYLYYSLSGSFVFTELGIFDDQNILSFGKVRASIAQVGDDIGPYAVQPTYNIGTPYGSQPALTVPNTLVNTNLKPAISSDYEFGLDTRYFGGDLRLDLTYYNSVREDEILNLQVPGSSGYNAATINAGEFVSEGVEAQLSATVLRNQDWIVDLTANWATNTSKVNALAEGLDSRLLESAYFGPQLYARVGEEWGKVIASGYEEHENGGRIVNSNGSYAIESNKDLGSVLPEWTGGFRTDVSFQNFTLGAFIEFQKGGQFYSITRMFNAYSGLGTETVGNNTLGNPLRDPVLDSGGNTVTSVPLGDASSESGGVLVEGVDSNGNDVSYLVNAFTHYGRMFGVKEKWMYDASFIKLREVKLTYNLPSGLLESLPISRASVALDVRNALLLYSSVDGIDPSIIQNGTTGFSWWEGGGVPGTRSIGLNVNVSF